MGRIIKIFFVPFFSARVTFVHAANISDVLHGTPLDDSEILQSLETSMYRIHHISDALRLALIYKVGGWYADIDTVIMKPLTDFPMDAMDTFYITSDQRHAKEPMYDENGLEVVGDRVANGFFGSMRVKSPFLLRTMELFSEFFDNQRWSTGGANIMTYALKDICGVDRHARGKVTVGGLYTAEKCDGIRILPSVTFYPVAWTGGNSLFQSNRTPGEWMEFFANSYSVDFYQSSLVQRKKVMKPDKYGAKLPAYAALGPRFCPLSFNSQKMF